MSMSRSSFRQRIASRAACAPYATRGPGSAPRAHADGNRATLMGRVSNLQPPPGAPTG